MQNTIASILKQARRSSHLSVKQAASQLRQYGIDIASKTLYGYESGLSMPNADVFVALCKIYQYEEPYLLKESPAFLPDPPTAPLLSQNELTILRDYNKLDSSGQKIVRQIIAHEKERVQQIHDLHNRQEEATYYEQLPDRDSS